jgi:parallel beta-helix repeat protein
MSGIAYIGSARGVACNNTCRGNEEHGIHVDQEALPTVVRNKCHGNKWNDIVALR